MIGEVPPGWSVGTIPESAIPKHPTGRAQKAKKNAEKDGISPKARALIKKGHFTAARSELRALSKDETHKDKASVFYWLGLIDLYQRKKPDQAAACFAKAYHHCEKSKDKKDDLLRIWVLLRLTETLLAKNNEKEAKIVFAQCEQYCERLKTPMTKKLTASLKRTKARMARTITSNPQEKHASGPAGAATPPVTDPETPTENENTDG
jgi:TolA-binding protein